MNAISPAFHAGLRRLG